MRDMPEILFRGKRADNGEWVYGNYCEAEMHHHGGTEYFIIEYSCDGSQYYINPETRGRYTGLTDKNGVKIFEGDILKGLRHHGCGECVECEPCRTVVTWEARRAGFYPFYLYGRYIYDSKFFEVIGNVHDNPELLEGGGEK